MALPAATKRYTLEEYLRLDEQAVERHEFHDGEILAMSGGTYAHSLICANVVSELRGRLRGTPCRVVESNMRVSVGRGTRFVYPDASVVCNGPQFELKDAKRTTIVNPRVIVQVLSASTEGYDRGEKFRAYRTVESLQEYVLVSQDRPLVETFVRQASGNWLLYSVSGLDAVVQIRTLEVDLPLNEVFAGVDFPPDDTAAGARAASA